MPRNKSDENHQRPAVANREKPGILVVDDDPVVCELLRDALSGTFQVFTAADSENAFTIIRRETIAIIISDQHLPGEDGLSLLTRLGQSNRRIQRLLITGDRSKDLILQAVNEGNIFKFIPKPFSPANIRTIANKALDEYYRMYKLEKAEREVASKELKSNARCRHHIIDTGRSWNLILQILGLVTGAMLILLLGGIAIIMILYFLKSALGLDLMPDAHFNDIIKHFM